MEFSFVVNFKTKTLTSVYNIICVYCIHLGCVFFAMIVTVLTPYEAQKKALSLIYL